jgi:hypothetical protein
MKEGGPTRPVERTPQPTEVDKSREESGCSGAHLSVGRKTGRFLALRGLNPMPKHHEIKEIRDDEGRLLSQAE